MEFFPVILTVMCTVALVKITKLLYKRHVYRTKINKVPGMEAYPIIGNYLDIMRVHRDDRFEWLLGKLAEYNDGIFRWWIGEIGNIIISSPKHMEKILPSMTLIKKSLVYKYIMPWLGTGLVTASGEKWHRMRKMITPSFHFKVLEDFAVVMSEKAEILNECIEKKLIENPSEPIDIFVLSTSCTLDIICESAMGVNIDSQRQIQSEYPVAIHSISKLAMQRVFYPWLHWDWLFYKSAIGKEFKEKVDYTHNITKEVIRERKLARLKEKKEAMRTTDDVVYGTRKCQAFLDLLLDASERENQSLSDDELQDEVTTFMFAGHDTTSVAVSFALFCLGNSLDIQDKVHEELKDVFGDSTEPATQKQLAQLKYLGRVMKESLRLYPSVPMISRSLTEEIEVGGYTLPKGIILSLHIFKTHRDPESWLNPNVFDPDRFLPENSNGRHAYAYLPFSAGPRNCIGQKFATLEEKIILTALLRKWRVKSVLTHDQMKCYSDVILRPQRGVQMIFTPK